VLIQASLLPLLLSASVGAAALRTDQIDTSIHQVTSDAPRTSVKDVDGPVVLLYPRARTGMMDSIYDEGLVAGGILE